MRRIFPVLVLIVMVIGFVTPTFVMAQTVPADCVKLRADVKIRNTELGADVTYHKGAVIASRAMSQGECPFVPTGVSATPANFSIQTKCSAVAGANKEVLKNQACYTNDFGMIAMLNVIYTATNWLFMIIMLIAVIMIVVGGFTYMTASGDPEKAGKGKTIIVYALIGIAIALFAKVLPSIIRFIMGV